MSSRIYPAIILLGLCLTFPPGSHATEGATNFYQLASRDLMAGVQPRPGIYIREDVAYYHGTRDLIAGKSLLPLQLDYWLSLTRFVGVTPYSLLGGAWGMAIAIPVAAVDLDISSPSGGKHHNRVGLGDITLTPVTLGWHGEQLHTLFHLSAYLPTGSFNKSRTLNIGKNRYAIDTGLAVTWLPKPWELSVVAGYTVSSINTDTDYHSGDEFHLDLSGAYRSPAGWAAGVTGFAFIQTTPDSGSGAVYGANQGQVFAVGPIFSYSTRITDHPLVITTKYLQEFAARNRYSGESVWFNLFYGF